MGRRLRLFAERALRVALIVALLVAIRHARYAMDERPSVIERGGDGAARSALTDWSTVSSPQSAHLRFDSTPSPLTREWAAALRGAGTELTWTSSLPAAGISVEPIADPKGRSRVWLASPAKSRIALSDSIGAFDTVVVRALGASAGPLQIHGSVRAAVGGAVATAPRPDSLVLRPLLVLGRAGWEAKFVVASLAEYGWQVSARLNVAPGNDAIQGPPAASIDTSHYSAVVVLDSSASRFVPAIDRFVRSGGGLVALGEGASLPALQPILPAGTGDPVAAGEIRAGAPRAGLAMRSLLGIKPDAIVLEKRGKRVAVAARRVGNGRVVQVGYEDSWRWRMSGSGDAVEEYRDWISSVVSSAAYAARVPAVRSESSDPAPLAAIHSTLGPPSAAEPQGLAGSESLMLDLFIVAIAALVLETASRRLDGKP